jgi:uncharacterized Tic20 family protein
MQSIDHKGLCVKCDDVGLSGAIGYYSHIYLGNFDFTVWILLCVLKILFIGSATIMIQENSWRNIIPLLLSFIGSDKILLISVYVICVIDRTVVEDANHSHYMY